MTKLLILLLCFSLQFSYGQTKQNQNSRKSSDAFNDVQKKVDDSADIYISRLNCNSAIVTTTYFSHLLLDSSGQRLVDLNDKNLNSKLLLHIDDTSKILALHIILTRRLEIDKGSFGIEYVYDSSYKNVLRVNFSCNGFNWYFLLNEKNKYCMFHIDKSEIDKIKLYWTDKLKMFK